jgi:signal transduction histidine kinase
MIWESQLAMGALDVLFIVAAVVAFAAVATGTKSLRAVGIGGDLLLIWAGLGLMAAFYLIDLVIMFVLPLWSEPMTMMERMEFWHLNASWYFNLLIAGLVGLGFVRLVLNLDGQLNETLRIRSSLERELADRTSMEDDIKGDAERQRAASRAKSEFLAGMSHEFRTPLNGILGLSSLLANTDLDDEQRRLLATIEESGQVLLKKVNEVLDLSELEIGGVELQSDNFRVGELVGSVEALFAPLAAEKGLTLTSRIVEEEDSVLMGDTKRLRQLLSGLISNAIKFTPSGSVDIEARLGAPKAGRRRLSLTVTDTGVGMEEAVADRLSRPPEHIANRGPGEPGIGLAICWRIVALMDGSLTVTSRPDIGSVFTVDVSVGYSDA